MRLFLCCLLVAATGAAMTQPVQSIEAVIYVSPNGSDQANGRYPDLTDKARGPFRTAAKAIAELAEIRKVKPETDVVIQFMEGVHQVPATIRLTPDMFPSATAKTVFTRYRNQNAIISGARVFTDWGKTSEGYWQTKIAASDGWQVNQLFVNGRRATRPRLPENGYFFISSAVDSTPQNKDKGYDRFQFYEGDINKQWDDLESIEALGFHQWTMSRMKIKEVDWENRTLTYTGPTASTVWWADLRQGQRYILENVKAAFGKPGQFYHDVKAGVLSYIPLENETQIPPVAYVPITEILFEVAGDIPGRQFITNLSFSKLVFAHSSYLLPGYGYHFPQAEATLSGIVRVNGGRDILFEECRFTRTGGYGLELHEGCRNVVVRQCRFTDLGAGGIKIGRMQASDDPEVRTSHVTVQNNLFARGGRVHPAGIGIWLGHTSDNKILKNEIFDFYYTGISVGWSWGYGHSECNNNLISGNHIHQIGQTVLSDMGGIYTLGLSPGTVLEYNHIHDIQSHTYGGWGIYFDEGTTGMVARNNLVYRARTGGFHQHYGKDNLVENNIFAFAEDGQIKRTRPEDHLSFTFVRNIVYFNEGPLLEYDWSGNNYKLDYNIYWDASGREIDFKGLSFEDWKKKGQDIHSVIENPGFRNAEKDDFTFTTSSVISKTGFKPFDLPDSGPSDLKSPETASVDRVFPPNPGPPPPVALHLDFDSQRPGEKPTGVSVFEEENAGAICRITDEKSRNGKHSLKFTDSGKASANYIPLIAYITSFNKGSVTASFWMYVPPGNDLYHQWRDGSAPYKVGPSFRVRDDKLLIDEKPVRDFPLDQWVKVTIHHTFDPENPVYGLTFEPENAPEFGFKNLKCAPGFDMLAWFGFVSDGKSPAVFYLDEVTLHEIGK